MTEHYNMHSHIEELIERKEKADLNGGQEKIDRHNKLGFYTARQRIAKLVDPETFLELGKLAHSDQQGVESKRMVVEVLTGLAKGINGPVVFKEPAKTVFEVPEEWFNSEKLKAITV